MQLRRTARFLDPGSSSVSFPSGIEEALGRELLRRVAIAPGRIRFVNSGTEAVMLAVRTDARRQGGIGSCGSRAALPVGAIFMRSDLASLFSAESGPAVAHSGTFNGNALTTAAGLACVERLDRAQIERINALTAHLCRELRAVFSRYLALGGRAA
jgi:glutamate-1-semialdehyde aminotransferase